MQYYSEWKQAINTYVLSIFSVSLILTLDSLCFTSPHDAFLLLFKWRLPANGSLPSEIIYSDGKVYKKHPFHSPSIYVAGKAYCSHEITTLKHFQLFYSFIKILARTSINAVRVYFLYKLSCAFHLSSSCLSASTNAWRRNLEKRKHTYLLEQHLFVAMAL